MRIEMSYSAGDFDAVRRQVQYLKLVELVR